MLRPRILFENKHVIAINKHAGQSFHSGGHQSLPIKGYFQQMKEMLMDDHFANTRGVDLYPVHRLDSITSGVLLLAKSKDAAREFQEIFAGGGIDKYYVALSDRKPRKKMGHISGDIVKGRRGSYKLTRTMVNPSTTRFVSKKVTLGQDYEKTMHAFLVKPITGKTHQIRVALKSLGSPVLGDCRYGRTSDACMEKRGYLHCAAIRCTICGEHMEIVCNPFQDGGYFESCEAFKTVFSHEWFSAANTHPHSLWFPELSLVSSSPARLAKSFPEE